MKKLATKLTRHKHENGFTLVEVMIVVAIIGILAAIAIPNFISYRDKAYCKAAESDVTHIASAINDYYAIPNRANLVTEADLGGDNAMCTGTNTSVIAGNINAIIISVIDGTGRCPNIYMMNHPDWTAATSTFTKTIQ